MNRTIAVAACLLMSTFANAWDSHGHAVVTYLAFEAASDELPAWALSTDTQMRAAYQASEADRWRGTRMVYLNHENKQEHYLDLELLEQFGLSAESLPRLRKDYLRTMAIAKVMNPEEMAPYDAARDVDGSREWPGFLPYAIMEHYTKLRSSFHTVRVLEEINDPERTPHLEQARANAIYHMGMLSHFVGDAAQPLHTTEHHNGWVGENPNGYTTRRGFHSYIDGGVLRTHGIDFPMLRDQVGVALVINEDDPWLDAMAHIQRSFDEMEALYILDRDGELDQSAGKQFISWRLTDAGRTLGGFYAAAWRHAEPTEEDLEIFLRYTGLLAPETPALSANAAND